MIVCGWVYLQLTDLVQNSNSSYKSNEISQIKVKSAVIECLCLLEDPRFAILRLGFIIGFQHFHAVP